MDQLNEKQKNRLLKLAEVLDDGDLALLKYLHELEDRMPSIDEATGVMAIPGPKGDKGESIVGPQGRDGKDGRDGRDGYTPQKNIDYRDGRDGKDGKDGEDGIDGQDGRDGKDGSPDTPDQIIDKVNESKKKIKKERIEGLTDELKAIRLLPRGGGASRRVFQPKRDDLSSSCDGATKIFYLSRSPLDDGTLMVFGTDFPTILRPTIDFTIANKTLTLTSAVPAPSQGATLICTYFA